MDFVDLVFCSGHLAVSEGMYILVFASPIVFMFQQILSSVFSYWSALDTGQPLVKPVQELSYKGKRRSCYDLSCILWALTLISLASFLCDIGKQNSPRWDTAERGVPSGAILFIKRIFIEK